MVKLSDLRTADQVAAEHRHDPEFRAAQERSRLPNEIAIAVLRHRVERGLSQSALARDLGMRQPHVARLEAGEHMPTIDMLTRLARVLRIDFSIDVPPDGPASLRAGDDLREWAREHERRGA